MKTWLSLAVVVVVAQMGYGQSKLTDNVLKLDEGTKPGKATLADAAFLVGDWRCEALGGHCEEVWIPAAPGGKEMMGMFRLTKAGSTTFTEHCALTEVDGTLVMKIKHFDKDFKGWEEKDKFTEFKLIKAEKDALFFDRLTAKKTDKGMTIWVAMRDRNDGNKPAEMPFPFTPAKK
jgi:hypothetical protein